MEACVAKVEERLQQIPFDEWRSRNESSKADFDRLVAELTAAKTQVEERNSELLERQADLTDLLNKLMTSKQEFSQMYRLHDGLTHAPRRRESLTGRIKELDDESEHWRRVGKEADEKMDGLIVSLNAARAMVASLEAAAEVRRGLILTPL